MKMILIKPEITKCDTFADFSEEFHLCERDLILTQGFMYDRFMKGLNLKCNVILQDKYGLGEPDDIMVNSIFAEAKQFDYDRIVAVGGGTVIDIGKLMALEPVEDVNVYYSKALVPKKRYELLIVPTTCGTGSEVTNKAIIGITRFETKMGIDSDELCADNAVLIKDLVRDLPLKVFMHSSVDAFVHAAESFVAPKSTTYTELFALDAIEKIISGYKLMGENGADYRKEIIEQFVLASNEAGIAFGNTGVGAVHAMAMAFGGEFHVPHGEANYEFLVGVFKKYISINPDGKIKTLNGILARNLGCNESEVYEKLEELLNSLIRRQTLEEYGMKRENLGAFADKVIASQQRLLVNNYVPLSKENLVEILEELY